MSGGRGLIIGLTGGMACGKSSVARIWQEHRAYVLNADYTVHRLLAQHDDVRAEVRDAFGDDVFDEDADVDRAALGRVVFTDEAARQRLMAILHPRTRESHLQAAAEFLREHPDGVVVIDAPLLFEAGLDEFLDATVVISAPHETQVTRAIDRAFVAGRPISREEVERRIALQMPLEEKKRRASFILENDGTLEELRRKAEALWEDLKALAPTRPGVPA